MTNENPFCQNNVDSAAYSRIGSYAPGRILKIRVIDTSRASECGRTTGEALRDRYIQTLTEKGIAIQNMREHIYDG